MSNLTKVSAMLLAVFAIFLCGMVIAYVGSANNYKALSDERGDMIELLESENDRIRNQYKEKSEQFEAVVNEKNRVIQQREEKNSNLVLKLRNAQRTSADSQNRVNSWLGLFASFEQTIANLELSWKLTQKELDKTRADNIADRKKLNEITANLYEKIVQMAALETDKRRLLEQKTGLEEQIDQLLEGETGSQTVTPVTQYQDFASPAVSSSDKSELNGLMTKVSSSLVTISIGSADGVKKSMVFHVTRGNKFICDVIVTDVDVNKSAGVLDLVQDSPRVGDTVSTEL